MMDISSLNISHVLKIAWKWSSWSLIWKQDGKNVSFISHIHVRFLSCVIVLLFCRCCCRSTCPPKKTWARKSSQNRDISTWSGCKNTCGYSTNKMQCSVKFAPPPPPTPQKKTGRKKKFRAEKGCTNFQTSTLMRHISRRDHKNAVNKTQCMETWSALLKGHLANKIKQSLLLFGLFSGLWKRTYQQWNIRHY